MNWYRLAQSIESEFPAVTLYHGSLALNLQNILKEGIRPRQINIDAIVNSEVQEILQKLGITVEQVEELDKGYFDLIVNHAKERLGQSKFDKVYLSGDKSYAQSNAAAGSEWYDMLVSAFLSVRYKVWENIRSNYYQQLNKMYNQLESLDKQVSSSIPENAADIYERQGLYQRRSGLERTIKQYEEDFQKNYGHVFLQKKLDRKNLMSGKFGNETVIFKVEMPYQVFKNKVIGNFSQDRIKLFESRYQESKKGGKNNWFDSVRAGEYDSVWKWFHEVHLSFVEPEYIVGYEKRSKEF
jgi:regulator of replication initiation timing